MSFYEYHVARRYIQFEDALLELPKFAALVGRKILILMACDPVREEIEAKIRKGIAMASCETVNQRLTEESPRYARYVPMCDYLDGLREKMTFDFLDLGEKVICEKNVRIIADHVLQEGYDTVVGIGGGKGQDFARAVTRFVNVKVILVPTLAATNASVSTLSVIYSEDGSHLEAYWRMDNAPDLVLTDTSVLVRNPPHVLSAGIGDIAATYYEALCNLERAGNGSCMPMLGRRGVEIGISILEEQAPYAIEAVKKGVITPAFENVLSLIMHNCGPLNMICTTGYAHVLDEMFLWFDAAHRTPHGLRVGYATIPMLHTLREGKEKARRYVRFCRSAGIPTKLSELGLEGISRESWKQAFDGTLGKTGNHRSLPFPVEADNLIDSLFEAEALTES